jgi:hypothetical protein
MNRPGPSAPLMVQRALEFPIPDDVDPKIVRKDLLAYVAAVNEALGLQSDPKIRFNLAPFFGKPRVEVDYSAQQLLDQYPRFLAYLNQSGKVVDDSALADAAGHKTGMPKVLTEQFGGFFDKRASQQNEEAHKELLGQAVATAKGLDYSHVDERVPWRAAENNYAEINEATDSTAGVIKLLKTEEGVIIGENHSDDENRALLVALLPHLTQSGVTTIYLEAVRADYQELVDAYLKAPSSAPMSPELYRFLRGKGESKSSYLQVLQAIKAQGGLAVKAIDSLAATSRPYGGDSNTRDMARELAMNQYAANTVRGDKGRSKGSKYIILAGRAHSNTQEHRGNTLGMTDGVPGLSQLLGVPAVHTETGGAVPQFDPEHRKNRVDPTLIASARDQLTKEALPLSSSAGDDVGKQVPARAEYAPGSGSREMDGEVGGRPDVSELELGSSGIGARAPMGMEALNAVEPSAAVFDFLNSLDPHWEEAPAGADGDQGMIVGQGSGVMLGSAVKAKEAAPVGRAVRLPGELRFLNNDGSGALCFVYSVVMGLTGRRQGEVEETVRRIVEVAGVKEGWIASDSDAARRVLDAVQVVFGRAIQVVELQNSNAGLIISGRSHNVARVDRLPVVVRNTGAHYDAIV